VDYKNIIYITTAPGGVVFKAIKTGQDLHQHVNNPRQIQTSLNLSSFERHNKNLDVNAFEL
jgi:hypothetical protein